MVINPGDISRTAVGESPDCLFLSGTVVGGNQDTRKILNKPVGP